jgi:hypothetical protein
VFQDKHGVLEGWPETIPIEEDGEEGFFLSVRYLSPLRARVLDAIVEYGGGIVLLAAIIAFAGGLPELALLLFVTALALGFLYSFDRIRWAVEQCLLPNTQDITFLGRSLFIDKRAYSLDVAHTFETQPHDRTRIEELDLPRLRKTKQKIVLYYQESRHVVFRYEGQRVDIAEVFGVSTAQQLAMRLQLIDKLMTQMKGKGGARKRTGNRRS